MLPSVCSEAMIMAVCAEIEQFFHSIFEVWLTNVAIVVCSTFYSAYVLIRSESTRHPELITQTDKAIRSLEPNFRLTLQQHT